MSIIGLIPIYKPNIEEINNIRSYVGKLDYCFLLDDSGYTNEPLFKELIEENVNKVEYILNEVNLGLCASVNNGLREALKKGADWVLIMNPDGTFQNDAISIYREYICKNETGEVAIIAPRFNLDRRKREPGEGNKEIEYADMSGCLYNMVIFDELGLYDEKTYFYCLDAEYCLRVKRNGYRIIECSEAVLNHHPAETYEVKVLGRTVFKCGKDTPQRYYYQFRSGYYVLSIYHSFYHLCKMLYKVLKVVLFFDSKREYFKMIRLGIDDAKLGFYGNINDRNQ